MPQVFITRNFIKVEQAFANGYTTVSAQGSSRSSKTFSITQWLVKRCVDFAGTSVSIVRKTMPAIKRSVYRDFEEIMIAWGLWNDRAMNRSEFVYRFGNGSWIEFFSCENEQKMRGSKRQILFVNEANELAFIEWQQLQMRTTAFSLLDYNPSFTDEHWINLVNKEKKTYHFISTYKDNPFLEQKVIDEIESLQWKNKSLWQVYGLGQQAIVEGLIFTNVQTVDYIPREAERHRYIGVDYGYEHDPTAIVEVMFWGKRLYVRELCYRTHMLTRDIIAELKAITGSPEIISESADPRMIDEIYSAGLDIKPVHKFGGSIMAGITKMQEYDIIVTKDSENVLKEFKNYTYRQDKEGKWLNEPIDAYDHCFTGDTLVATIHGNKRIDCLQAGDLVLTSHGIHAVTRLFAQGYQKIWNARLRFNNFVIDIQATPNHRFKTAQGWKRLDELSAGCTMYLCKYLMEKSTGYTMASGTIREAQEDCTVSFGSLITGKFQRGGMCTIKMRTRTIMPLKILNSLKGLTTCVCTWKSALEIAQILKQLGATWKKRVKRLKNGIIQRLGEHGIVCTLKRRSVGGILKQGYVSVAAKNIRQNISGKADFVPIVAKRNGGGTTTLMMNSGFVSNVVKSSQLTDLARCNFAEEVVLEDITVLKESYEPTFDIEVETAHEFFANGILAHNCIDAARYVVLEKILGAGASGMDASGILGLL